jgi:redox-sensitive bicupin YhaK (pirin superfamily)
MSPLKIVPRLSQHRGHADHGWLKTFHTFSFASYADGQHSQYGALRVINEDRVAARTGFGTHSHREFEIFSYVVAGELEHKDSMGNIEVLRRGDLQLTSAGTGISHSEKAHGSKQVHFLQIWSIPTTSRLPPKYYTRHYSDAQKTNTLLPIVAPVGTEGTIDSREGEGPTPVHSELTLFASIITPKTELTHTFPKNKSSSKSRKAYIHVVQTSGYNTGPSSGATILVSGEGGVETMLREGDGAYIMGEVGKAMKIENMGEKNAEVLLFDLE